ncbi:hypothetical protein ACT17_28255 [Mycolicibacterium conceptionense]|uniref:Glyoxalase n=1 Tax=Mycolicibacterium conceptionense TaxID=451644 RepID=A0A0J8TZN0_9MYCO|nr:hypothetical protein [Mycolicibacterium conceptionense]KMV14833.1 hypothetical protein ACT17_28255 [Mycolicibacterium conceptionense]
MKLSRITIYTPAPVLQYAADSYAALLGAASVTGEDERGQLVEVTDADGFTIELRPVQLGPSEAITVTRLEFRGPDAEAAAERLHDETGGVQRHLYGGHWDTISGNTVRMIGPGQDVDPVERTRISAAIRRGELEQELERMNKSTR